MGVESRQLCFVRNIPITDWEELTRNVKKICAVMMQCSARKSEEGGMKAGKTTNERGLTQNNFVIFICLRGMDLRLVLFHCY